MWLFVGFPVSSGYFMIQVSANSSVLYYSCNNYLTLEIMGEEDFSIFNDFSDSFISDVYI